MRALSIENPFYKKSRIISPPKARILVCPFCGKEKQVMSSLISWHTYNAEGWSDGYWIGIITLGFRDISYIQKCRHCGKYYTLARQDEKYAEHGSFERGIITFSELKKAFKQLSEDGFFDVEDEGMVRLMLHGAYNDYYYRGRERKISTIDKELFQKNAVWLIENNIVHGRMKIEFYREIGDFEAARRLFALFKFVGIEEDSVLYAIRERLDAHDCKVFKIEEKILSIKDIKAGNVKRLLGHIIDVAFIIFITIMILKFTTIAESATISNLEIDLTYFASYFLYFLGMEAISNGKTIGKKLLRMSVTNNKGESPSMSKIGLRTLCRFIPFDILSFLWGGNWHDNISGTYVVSDNELKKFKEQHQ